MEIAGLKLCEQMERQKEIGILHSAGLMGKCRHTHPGLILQHF